MSKFRNREDIQDYLAYQQLNNFIRVLHNNPDSPHREPFFMAMARGQNVRIGGYEFGYPDLILAFLRGVVIELDDCADHVAVNILEEASAVTLDWSGDLETLSDDQT